MVLIDTTADEGSENRRGVLAREEIEPSVLQISDARREPEPEQGAEPEYMVGDAAGVRIVLFDSQSRLVIKQAVEHMRRLARCRGDGLRVVGAKLIGDVGVEGDPRLIAVTRVDVAKRFAMAAGAIILPIRR